MSKARERDRLAGYIRRPADNQDAAVGSAHHIRVEHLQQCLEVALARGRYEGVDDFALGVEVGIGLVDRGAGPLSGWTNRSSRPARGPRTCRLLLFHGCGRLARTQLVLAWDEARSSRRNASRRPLRPEESGRLGTRADAHARRPAQARDQRQRPLPLAVVSNA
jgi:hypothetical protein